MTRMEITQWMPWIPQVGYHHVLMVLLAISIILSSILLAGCSSSNMTAIYLLSLSYADPPQSTTSPDSSLVNPSLSSTFSSLVTNTSAPALEIRAGYMGFCMPDSTGDWICSRHADSLARNLNSTHQLPGSGDPLNLIYIAKNFQSQIVFDGLIFISVPLVFFSILLLGTFPTWHTEEDAEGSEREVKPFPSRPLSYTILALLTLSSLLIFVSVFWQHIAAASAMSMVQSLSYGTVKVRVGAVAMILGWVSVALDIIAAIGIYVMVASIRVLELAFGE